MISTTALNTMNTNRVLRTLWEREPISRIGIAKQLDLDKSTITKIMSLLVERKIVVEKEIGDSGPIGGRKPVNLGVNDKYGAVIGVELQTDLARMTAIDLTGEILWKDQQTLSFEKSDISGIFEEITIGQKRKLEALGYRVLGASLGLAGIVNPFTKTIVKSNPLSIHDPLHIDPSIEKRLGIPIFVENDTRCCCWAKLVDKRRTGTDHFMYVLGEFRKHNIVDNPTRVLALGFAFVVDGKVHYGRNFTSGEFSSVFKKDREPAQLSSPKGLVTLDGLGCPEQRKMMFEELAGNAAFLVNMLNLQTIGFAGDIVQFADELTPIFLEAIEANWSYTNQAEVEIEYNPFGEWAVAVGAASLILEQLFALPKLNENEAEKLPFGVGLFDLIDELSGTAP